MNRVRVKVILSALLAIGVLGFVAIWLASGQLVSPPRRPLQEYHLEWLNSPASHGISLARYSAMEGQVPCILAAPDAKAGPGERGKRLREQLAKSGIQLPPYGTIQGTMVLLHGRKGRKEDLLPVAERFCAAGFRCLLPDLPGHGESPINKVRFATTDMEARLPESVLLDAMRQFGFAEEPSTLWGMSMGGAFAVRAATESATRWSAVIIVSSFDTLSGVVEGQVNWAGAGAPFIRTAVGAMTLLRGGTNLANARPIDWAARINIPVLVAHGDMDTLIPLERGKALFDAFNSRNKCWVPVESGDHNRVLVTQMPLYATMAEWLVRVRTPIQQPDLAH